MTIAKVDFDHLTAIATSAVARIRENYNAFAGQFPAYGVSGEASQPATHYRLTPNQNWLASFWSGLLWLTAAHTRSAPDIQRARSLLPSFEARLDQRIRLNHDLGFLFTLSARAQWQFTGDEHARSLALRAAEVLLGRYHERGGYIQAWDSEPDRDERGRFIIDCMMNLPLLFWATRETGDARFRKAAAAHAHTSARHLMRSDGSTYHTYFFDPDTGQPVGARTHQGYADDSMWARGQAWAIYGFTLAAEWTSDQTLLAVAKSAADRYLTEAPANALSPWDYRLPAHEPAYPDSSADAIAVGGLLRLAAITKDTAYHDHAQARLHLLIEHALDTRKLAQGLMLHGTQHAPHNYGVDTYTIFGDFFFLEAVFKVLQVAPDFWGPDAK